MYFDTLTWLILKFEFVKFNFFREFRFCVEEVEADFLQDNIEFENIEIFISHIRYTRSSCFPATSFLFKETLESLEQGVKYVQISNRDTRTVALFWYLYCNFEHISHLGLVFLLLTLIR